MNKKFITISGNIGIGKSTLTKKLADHYDFKPYLEPFSENPYLQDFYKDMKKWAFHSQMYFLGKRLQDHYNLVVDKHSVIQDRCIYENAEIFARYMRERGFISKRDWKVYQTIYKTFIKVLPAPDLVIYLRASTDRIMKRIAERGREFEKNITEKYIADLNKLYDDWAGNFKLAQVIIINYDDIDLKYREIDFNSFLEVLNQYLK